jgi:uncharacterized protein YndB with AHSA1/START domain
MPATIRLHRVLRTAPERVYRAFLDPNAMVKWLPPNGFTATVLRISESGAHWFPEMLPERFPQTR